MSYDSGMRLVSRTGVRFRRRVRLLWRTNWTKRHLSDERNATKNAPDKSTRPTHRVKQFLSIPGPTWLWTTVQPLGAPFRAYGRVSKSHPYTTQLSSSLVIYFLGDLSSQYIRQRGEHPKAPGQALVDNYDPQRTTRALCIGSISSIPSYHWFIYLSTHFNVPGTWPFSTFLSLIYKIAINQALFTPIFNTYFFGMQSLLAGDGGPEVASSHSSIWDALAIKSRMTAAWTRVKETVPTSWYNSCKFWPFVTAFSFTFIPIRQRSPFAGCCAVVWQSYLGIINQRAVERENGVDEPESP